MFRGLSIPVGHWTNIVRQILLFYFTFSPMLSISPSSLLSSLSPLFPSNTHTLSCMHARTHTHTQTHEHTHTQTHEHTHTHTQPSGERFRRQYQPPSLQFSYLTAPQHSTRPTPSILWGQSRRRTTVEGRRVKEAGLCGTGGKTKSEPKGSGCLHFRGVFISGGVFNLGGVLIAEFTIIL